MNQGFKTIPQVQVLTATLCCWGDLVIPSEGRVVDYLNDPARRFFVLKQARVTGLDDQTSDADAPAEDVLIHRANVIAAIILAGSVPTPTRGLDAAPMAAERVIIYAPPYEIAGDIQRHPWAQLSDILSAAGGDLIAVENAAIRSRDSVIDHSNIHLAIVNRQAIHALRSLGQGEPARTSLWTMPKRQLESPNV